MIEFAGLTATSQPKTFVPAELQNAAGVVPAPKFGITFPATVRMAGVWGGATATLQVRPPDLSAEGDWISLSADTESTSDGVGVIDLCAGWSVRVLVAGATVTTNLNVRVY